MANIYKNAYIELNEETDELKFVRGEIEKKYDVNGREIERHFVKIPSNKFGIMCVRGIDECEFKLSAYDKFIVEAMDYYGNYTFDTDPTIDITMEKILFTNHDCENTTMKRTKFSADSDLCVFEYYDVRVSLVRK